MINLALKKIEAFGAQLSRSRILYASNNKHNKHV